MSKANDLAQKAYPQEIDDYCENNAAMRVGFKIGYCQAEKDLELTWEDIELIVNIDKDTDNEESIIGVRNNKEHYQEVLKRFKNLKKGKRNDIRQH